MVPVNLHTGLILIAIGSFTMITGINNWSNPMMTAIGFLALLCGGLFCLPLRKQA